jgi:tRNA threonylcarbamoyladenosine modification (KEOPS) complex Cgi121 subunit
METVSILKQISSDFGLIAAQIINNRFVWGRQHLLSAIWHAHNAEKNNRMISKTLSMEILLYTAGQRQIKKAIKLLGVKESTKDVVGILIGDNEAPLIKACFKIQKKLSIQLNLRILDDFSSKEQFFIQMLIKDGFSAREFTFDEIKKAIMQKIALLAIES